ncbi:hypothetical protein Droror1_Dr00023047 [Drosera rotundifolia]
MGHRNQLAKPLAIRVDVTPPPPPPNPENYASGCQQVAAIRGNPPSYSHLYELYAIKELATPEVHAVNAVNALMPLVYGFAMAMHAPEGSKKDGIALGMSLQNVARDQRVLASTYQSMWTRYIETKDAVGLIGLAKQALATQRKTKNF